MNNAKCWDTWQRQSLQKTCTVPGWWLSPESRAGCWTERGPNSRTSEHFLSLPWVCGSPGNLVVLLQTWSENVKHYILGLTHSKNQKSWFIKQLIGYNRFLPCVCYWLNYVHAPPPPPSIQYFRLCLCLEIWALKNELNKKEVIRVGRNPIDWCPYRKRRSGPRHNLGGECVWRWRGTCTSLGERPQKKSDLAPWPQIPNLQNNQKWTCVV